MRFTQCRNLEKSNTMGKLSESEKKNMRHLFEDNGLTADDIFTHKHFVIIKRTGIEKIQAKHNIKVHYSEVVISKDFVVIKAEAWIGDEQLAVETYGEAGPENCMNTYYVMTAEKRALSRAVLKCVGMYKEVGVYGEDEGVHHDG